MTPGAYGTDGELLESAFQGQVIGLAQFYGWRIYHPPDNKPRANARGRAGRQRVEAGFPDLVLLRGPELIIAELKRHDGRPTADQRAWLDAFEVLAQAVARDRALARQEDGGAGAHAEATVDVYLWRPADWPTIEKRLARGRVLQPWAP